MSNSLNICFGTMTGNAETLATEAHKRAVSQGFESNLLNLAKVKSVELAGMEEALFVVSTWGDGEPPDDAADFWYELENAKLDLSGLSYAVFGLGDKDYPEFNGFARLLDERLLALGAKRLIARAEADLDFDDAFAAWSEQIFPLLAVRRETMTADS